MLAGSGFIVRSLANTPLALRYQFTSPLESLARTRFSNPRLLGLPPFHLVLRHLAGTSDYRLALEDSSLNRACARA